MDIDDLVEAVVCRILAEEYFIAEDIGDAYGYIRLASLGNGNVNLLSGRIWIYGDIMSCECAGSNVRVDWRIVQPRELVTITE